MENTEAKNKVCFRCGKFVGFYTKELIRFDRTKLGYCKEYEKIVPNMDYCENWCNNSRKVYARKRASIRVLSELLTNIIGIKQILQESLEEEKNQ